jgi:D-xylose transport system ATP-binding protein
LVAQIAAGGTAVLYVSHRLEEIFKIAHRITVIRDGKSVRTADARDWTQDSVIAAMVGREDAASSTPLPTAQGEGRGVVLELKHWSVAKPGQSDKAALQDVHLSLRQGEILGLGGLMGSGRSALLSTLFGDWKGQGSGELSLFGVPQEPFRSPAQAIAQGLCLAGEDRKRQGLIGSASVLENITLASLARYSRRGLLDWPGLKAAAVRTQDELRIKAPSLDAEVLTLSGGNQQKVVLGRWMLIQPKILLLDEPTRGIDVSAKAEIHRLIRVLASQGLSVIVASSDLPELLSLSHRIVVFSQGRVAGELDQASFSPERVMRLATAA